MDGKEYGAEIELEEENGRKKNRKQRLKERGRK